MEKLDMEYANNGKLVNPGNHFVPRTERAEISESSGRIMTRVLPGKKLRAISRSAHPTVQLKDGDVKCFGVIQEEAPILDLALKMQAQKAAEALLDYGQKVANAWAEKVKLDANTRVKVYFKNKKESERRRMIQKHDKQKADIERKIARRVALQILQRGASGV
ncbi:hypothetical protein MMC15_005484 [Xylographa vitiligo]|nr:hypothetical protein [Xylographa vitiligo]